jgi:transmembrane sensor
MRDNKLIQIDTIIQHFIRGNATPDEERILYNRIKESPEIRKVFFSQKDLWDASQIGSPRLNESELNHWFELQERMESERQKTSDFMDILRIAAAVLIALSSGWFGHFLYSSGTFSGKQAEMKKVEALRGQVKEIFLADGTQVWLNSGSILSFPTVFTADNREIELNGEAFFEVTSCEDKPFLVKTRNHTVMVTGTRFNVREYPGSNIIETTLEEGKVKIITGNFIKDLMPGEQSSFNTETAKIHIGQVDMPVYTSWIDGIHEFNNESVSRIFNIIERWWDVEIDYPEERLNNERITGVLRRHKTLEQNFELIKQVIPIEYKIGIDKIDVSLKK